MVLVSDTKGRERQKPHAEGHLTVCMTQKVTLGTRSSDRHEDSQYQPLLAALPHTTPSPDRDAAAMCAYKAQGFLELGTWPRQETTLERQLYSGTETGRGSPGLGHPQCPSASARMASPNAHTHIHTHTHTNVHTRAHAHTHRGFPTSMCLLPTPRIPLPLPNDRVVDPAE